MKIQANRSFGAVAPAAMLACGTAAAAFPEKLITIVVPTAAGGAKDAMARAIGQAMSAVLKQSVIVDNKAGANGAIASEFVMRAPPDGYTLMLGYIATHAMNSALQKLRYDPVKDFEPVGMIESSANDVSQWYGIFAPAKTPRPILEQLNKVLNEVLADKAVIKRLEDHGAEVSIMTTDQMRTYAAQEQVKWKKVVQAAKIAAD